VVEESLRGFERGQVFVIPHWRYKAMVRFMKMTPEAWMRRVSIAMARRYRRPKA
jgi:short-subunit dehydrogenase